MTTLMVRSMPSIVYLTEDNPFDQSQGASIVSLAMIQAVAKHYQVHILYASRSPTTTQLSQPLSNVFCQPVYIADIDTPIKKRLGWLLTHYLHGKPHHFAAYQSVAFSNKVQELIERIHPVLLWADHVRLAQYWSEHSSLPLIITTHNIEWRLLYDCFTVAPKLGKWHFLVWWMEARLTKSLEQYFYQRAALVITLSHHDQISIHAFAPTTHTVVWPPALPPHSPQSNSLPAQHHHSNQQITSVISLLFVGNLNWFPNADALYYFLTKIWPLLTNSPVRYHLSVVGQPSTIYNFPQIANHFQSGSITFHGKVANLDKFYSDADVVILPFQVGGGIRIKMIEAIQYHKPIVTTSVGASGLPLFSTQKKSWIVADCPSDFAAAIALASQPLHRQELTRQTQLYAQKYQALMKKNQLIALDRIQAIAKSYQS